METPFVEEIDIKEVKFIKIIGRGAFGVVSHGIWRGQQVAVKVLPTEAEKKAFLIEVKQLSRVSHPNIVKLYAASASTPVFLVMEFAEGGSLYNVLHGPSPQVEYSTAHAISWSLQCAEAVAYLHAMEPKSIVHRDLKPPNLLLNFDGTILKICDFGTATEKQSNMTNNKGSAAWMAPEVFEGHIYNEKCDVFSFGIIFWEILTRRKPFEELGGQAYSIMWKVHSGTRPPPIAGLPDCLHILMNRCWAGKPSERPSFEEVVPILREVAKYLTGATTPLQRPTRCHSESDASSGIFTGTNASQFTNQSQYTNNSQFTNMSYAYDTRQGATLQNTLNFTPDGEPMIMQLPQPKQIVVEETPPPRGQISAPPSLAASRENLSSPSSHVNKRFSDDWSRINQSEYSTGYQTPPPHNNPPQRQNAVKAPRGHRRTGSYGSHLIVPENPPPSYTRYGSLEGRGHRRNNSHGNINVHPPLHHSVTAPANLNVKATTPSYETQTLIDAILPVDKEYEPIAACPQSEQSRAIFHEHCEYLKEYRQIQAEIAILTQKENDLQQELSKWSKRDTARKQRAQEYERLFSQNESLVSNQKELEEEVEKIRKLTGRHTIANV